MRKYIFLTSLLMVFGLASCGVNPEPTPSSKYSITITNKTDQEFSVGDSYDLSWSLMGDASLSFSSSDTSVASINDSGSIKALAPGSSLIKATYGDASDSFTFKVRDSSSCDVKITNKTSSIYVDNTYQVKVTTVGSYTLVYSSSNSNVASISESGLIKGLKDGSTRISVSYGQASDYFDLTVKTFVPGGFIDLNSSNPNATKVNISTLVAKSSSETKLYRIQGIVETNTYFSLGVFDISDDTGWIEVYGASSSTSCITESSGKYTFDQSKCTFGTLENTIHAGDEVIMEGVFTLYTNYKKTPEFQGYIVSYKNNNKSIPESSYSASETYSGSYYDSTDLTASGTKLCENLQTLMFNTHKTWTSYNGLYDGYSSTGEMSGSNYKCIYTGKTNAKNKTNREHVWAQSLSVGYPGSKDTLYGESGAGSDLHHVRPCTNNVNSTRSSKLFGQLFGKKSNTFDTNYTTKVKYTETIWEVPDQVKGDIARTVLYVYMHYNSGFSGGVSRSYVGALALKCIMAPTSDSESLKLLKYWNSIDPVDSTEMARNEGAYKKQGNRNPFIDHPTLVDKL